MVEAGAVGESTVVVVAVTDVDDVRCVVMEGRVGAARTPLRHSNASSANAMCSKKGKKEALTKVDR